MSRVDYGSKHCHNSPTLDEEPLHRAILAAINSTVQDRDNIMYNLKRAMEKELSPIGGQQCSLSDIDRQLDYLNTEFSKVLAEASVSGDQTAYNDRFREIMKAQAELKTQREETAQLLAENSKTATHIEECIRAAESTPTAITDWDEAVIRQVVERVTVEVNGGLTVRMKNGTEVCIKPNDIL